MPVVVMKVFDEDRLEVSDAEHESAVETLLAQGPDHTLADGVCSGRRDGRADDLDTFSGEDGVPLNRPIIINSSNCLWILWIVWISRAMVLLGESA
jgi:hypothetical protein